MMAGRVDFYQVSRDPAEHVVVPIARRILAENGRLLVVSADRAQLERTSAALWDAGPASYLANDHADAPEPQVQPVLLNAECVAPNGARHIALIDGAWRDAALGFDRVFYFFDDRTIDVARSQWRSIKAMEGVAANFWRQEGGRWTQVA